jgi:hypothetical protein
MVLLEIWNRDGAHVVTGTWPLIDPGGDLASGSAALRYYRADPPGSGIGVGGSVRLTVAGPTYVGSFDTTVNGESLSGSFSTAVPNECACTMLANGATECPFY